MAHFMLMLDKNGQNIKKGHTPRFFLNRCFVLRCMPDNLQDVNAVKALVEQIMARRVGKFEAKQRALVFALLRTRAIIFT
jgi:hypothetical protein